MVFNVLGLLVHEIVMHAPIVSVQWVGDMSAPSVLPNRMISSLLPSPGPVMDDCVPEAETLEDDEEGTIRKIEWPGKDHGRNGLPFGRTRTLFSDAPGRRDESRKPSALIHASPLQIEATRERPRIKAMIRPRIATETFRSPTSPTEGSHAEHQGSTACHLPTIPAQVQRKHPLAPNFHSTQQILQDDVSDPYSGLDQNCDFSDPEWFTPPSTRRDARKAPRRSKSPPASRNMARPGKTQSPTTPKDTAPFTTANGPKSALHKDARDDVRSRQSPSQPMGLRLARLRQEDTTPTSAYTPQQRPMHTSEMPDTPESPSSVYSRSISGFFLHQAAHGQGRQWKENNDNNDGGGNNEHASDKAYFATTLPLLPSPPTSPPSRAAAITPVDGAMAACLGSEEPPYAGNALGCEAVREIAALREDYAVLRREVVALKKEVCALRSVVGLGGGGARCDEGVENWVGHYS